MANPQPESFLTRRQNYELMRGEMIQERQSFDSHWKELGDFLVPRRPRFWVSDRNKGDRRSQNIINSTPRTAQRTLQSGLHAGLTSPARPWMRLTTPDPDLADFGPVKEWLHTVTRRMLDVFLKSNLYNALPILYGDVGVFASGAMSVLEDEADLMRSYCYPVGSYALGLDDRGKACAWVRDYQMTVRACVKQFGTQPGTKDIDWSRFSETIKTAWAAKRFEQAVEVCWIVTPNEDRDPKALYAKDAMPWQSCYFERGRQDDNLFLRESGFRQFPILAPRWDVTGEDIYGTDGPGITTLGDIKGLQLLERRKAKAIDKALDPPLTGPSSLRTQKTSLLPGDVTYLDVRDGMQGLRPIHEVRLEGLQHLSLEIQRHEDRINKGFYADLFLMLANSDRAGAQPITAREVEERHEEKLLALGPVLERLNDELLDPLIDRTFALMLAGGLIPPPPEELHGVALRVEYTSIMAQAQRLVGVVGQDRFITSTMNMASVFPDVRHKLNVFQAVDDYAEMLGVNPKLVRTNDDATADIQAERQAQQQAQQAEQAKSLAAAGSSMAKTPLGGDTALNAVLSGAQSERLGAAA
jgi:hypothetical protein